MKALLFMKKHSARLPGKNIREFCSKPLFCWIIETLGRINGIKEICLDTDSEVIKDAVLSRFPDVNVMMRPKHLCGDHVTANDLIRGMLSRIDGEEFLQTHVTNPLLRSGTIINAWKTYRKNQTAHDSLMTVTKLKAPFYDSNYIPINHEVCEIEQHQYMEPVYMENSNLYIFSRQTFELWGRTGLNPYFYEMSKRESIDIDTEDDWIIAEAVKRCAD